MPGIGEETFPAMQFWVSPNTGDTSWSWKKNKSVCINLTKKHAEASKSWQQRRCWIHTLLIIYISELTRKQRPNRTVVKIYQKLVVWSIHFHSSPLGPCIKKIQEVKSKRSHLPCNALSSSWCWDATWLRDAGLIRWHPCFGYFWVVLGVCSLVTRFLWMYKKSESHTFSDLTWLSLSLSLSLSLCFVLYHLYPIVSDCVCTSVTLWTWMKLDGYWT